MEKIILKNKSTNEKYEITDMNEFIDLLNTGKIVLYNGNNSNMDTNNSLEGNEFEILKDNNKHSNHKKNGNGQGSFYYSDTLKKWIGQYGRKTITQRKNETKTQCKERWEQMKSEIKNGTYIEKNKITINDILKDYINSKYANNKVIASTYVRNKYYLKELNSTCKSIMNKPIQNITTSEIQKVLPCMTNYSDSIINKIYALLEKAFKIAVCEKIISFNIMESESIEKPKSLKNKKEVKALTIEEERKLRHILNNDEKEHKYKDIILLMLDTGMRIGEVLALTRDCVDLEQGTIRIYRSLTKDENDRVIVGEKTKTNNSKRTIYLTAEAVNICRRILNNRINNINLFLFYDYEKEKCYTQGQVYSYLQRIKKKYKIEGKTGNHIMRHTYATRYNEARGDMKVLQSNLGHTKIGTTMNIYVNNSIEHIEEENKKYESFLENKGIV